jgi:gluconolactonase
MKKNIDLVQLARLDFYTEGPAQDHAKNFYFTTLTGGAIMQLDKNGILSEWARTDCPNGQIILSNGQHLVCDSKLGRVLRFSASGQLMGDATGATCAGTKVHVPNDLMVDAKDNLYFTDSIRHDGAVFFVGADGTERLVAGGLDYPNGIAMSNDGRILFVAESYKNRIIQFELDDAGMPTKAIATFIDLPRNPSGKAIDNLPDGIAINGNNIMAVAHYGMQSVHLVSPEGELMASYDTGMPCTSNVYFLDDDRLLVTGGYAEPGPGAVFTLNI